MNQAADHFPIIDANGKLILLGEHSVVYGYPAMAIGLPDGLRLEKLDRLDGTIRAIVPDWNFTIADADDSLAGAALRKAKSWLVDSSVGFNANLKASIPIGAGLGSSAAFSVVIVKIINELNRSEWNIEEIHRKSHELETVFHGEASGLDDTLSVYGGNLLYTKNGWSEPSQNRFDYPLLTPTTRMVKAENIPLLIGHSGVPRQTKKMVADVRRRYEKDRLHVTSLFEQIERIVESGAQALSKADWKSLGGLMNENQEILHKLMLSCSEIDKMIDLAKNAGAYGVKLTGAGGGGCVVAIADPDSLRSIEKAWTQDGFNCWVARNDCRQMAGEG